MTIKEIKITELVPYENNPRINDNAVEAVANSIREFGFKVPVVIDKDKVIVAGHTRIKAAEMLGMEKVPCIVADDLTPDQIKAFRLVDNKTSELATWDFEKLETELNELADEFDMQQFGFDELDFEEGSQDNTQTKDVGGLVEKFIVPPFSVLDTRQGYWTDRKRLWRNIIKDDGSSRGDAKLMDIKRENFEGYDTFADVSLLDPVLCEIIMKWFFPKQGKTAYDCFAGDTVFGFVSASCGAKFTGIELREEQVNFNRDQVSRCNLTAQYICDDGRNINKHIKDDTQDLFFSCPPYFDLEVYSDKPNDASNQETYEDFYAIIEEAFTNAAKCLKNNRFAVIVVGDVRNRKTGEYYGFVDDIKETFKRNGFILYNEIILLNPVGSAAMRAARYMESRKVAKIHQNVLVFYKGDTKEIPNNFEKIEYKDEDILYASENE